MLEKILASSVCYMFSSMILQNKKESMNISSLRECGMILVCHRSFGALRSFVFAFFNLAESKPLIEVNNWERSPLPDTEEDCGTDDGTGGAGGGGGGGGGGGADVVDGGEIEVLDIVVDTF